VLFGLWPDADGFIKLLHALRKAGRKIVVTPHTIFPFGGAGAYGGFFADLAKVSDVIIAHTMAGAAALTAAGANNRVVVIPHGTPTKDAKKLEGGRELLDVPENACVGLVPGFQGPNKNVFCTIRGFARALNFQMIRNKRPTYLVVAGWARNEQYAGVIRGVIAETGYSSRLRFHNSWFNEKDTNKILSAADYIVLNTQATTLSSSGQVHQALGAGIPFAFADRPIYSDGHAAGGIPFDVDKTAPEHPTDSAVNAIATLASDTTLLRKESEFKKTTSWDALAAFQYQRLYGNI